MQDKSLLLDAFPSLAQGLTPIAAAHGLKAFSLPATCDVVVLHSCEFVELTLSAIISTLEIPTAHLVVSLDAEWNLNRHAGCSIIQLAFHNLPNKIFLIPVGPLAVSPLVVQGAYGFLSRQSIASRRRHPRSSRSSRPTGSSRLVSASRET